MISDQAIIKELKDGNIRNLGILVERYQLTAIRAAFLILQDEDLAKDISADGFVRAYENIHKFDSEKPFGPWLYTIVTNLARRYATRENRIFGLESVEKMRTPDLVPEHVEIEARMDAQARQARLQAALRRLGGKQRAILVQYYYLEMSVKEIAEQNHVPEGTVKWQLHRARQKLKDQINKTNHEEKK